MPICAGDKLSPGGARMHPLLCARRLMPFPEWGGQVAPFQMLHCRHCVPAPISFSGEGDLVRYREVSRAPLRGVRVGR